MPYLAHRTDADDLLLANLRERLEQLNAYIHTLKDDNHRLSSLLHNREIQVPIRDLVWDDGWAYIGNKLWLHKVWSDDDKLHIHLNMDRMENIYELMEFTSDIKESEVNLKCNLWYRDMINIGLRGVEKNNE